MKHCLAHFARRTITVMIALGWMTLQGLAQSGPVRALALDGATDEAMIPWRAPLNPFPLTVMGWVRTSQSSTGMHTLFACYRSPKGWSLHLSGGRLAAIYSRGDGSQVTVATNGTPFIADSRWHHVALRVSTNGAATIVDGTPVASGTWTGEPGVQAGSESLRFGRVIAPADSYFGGQLDEWSLWATNVANTRISEIRHQVLTAQPGLVAVWRFNETGGSIFSNSLSAAHFGYFSNQASRVESTAPVGVPECVVESIASVTSTSSVVRLAVDGWAQPGRAWLESGPTPSLGATQAILSFTASNASVRTAAPLGSLPADTTWFCRVCASNLAGIGCSTTTTFRTQFPAAVVQTLPAIDITDDAATLRARVEDGGRPTEVWFEWGLDTTYGNTSSPVQLPGDNASQDVLVRVESMLPGDWWFRVVAARSNSPTAVGAAQLLIIPTREVTTGQDSGPGSLRNALRDAAPGTEIRFAEKLPPIQLITPLVITQDVSIAAPPGNRLILMPASRKGIRLLEIAPGVTATFSEVEFRDGISVDGAGGAVLVRGNLVARRCTFSGNRAFGTAGSPGGENDYGSSHGGGGGGAGGGGAVFVVRGGAFSATDCAFTGNLAGGGYGGPSWQGGLGGGGGGFGGALFNDGGLVRLVNCTLAYNEAWGGYAGYRTTSPVGVSPAGVGGKGLNSTSGFGCGGDGGTGYRSSGPPIEIPTFAAPGEDGGFGGGGGGVGGGSSGPNFFFRAGYGGFGAGPGTRSNAAAGTNGLGLGGAVFSRAGSNELIHCTFHENYADAGSGLYQFGGVIRCQNSVVGSERIDGGDVTGQFESLGHNLIRNRGTVTNFNQPGDLTGVPGSPLDPLLSSLEDYGGVTKSCVPLKGSPLLNAAAPGIATTDQRGAPRPAFGAPDIGATEALTFVSDMSAACLARTLRATFAPELPESLARFEFAIDWGGDIDELDHFLVPAGQSAATQPLPAELPEFPEFLSFRCTISNRFGVFSSNPAEISDFEGGPRIDPLTPPAAAGTVFDVLFRVRSGSGNARAWLHYQSSNTPPGVLEAAVEDDCDLWKTLRIQVPAHLLRPREVYLYHLEVRDAAGDATSEVARFHYVPGDEAPRILPVTRTPDGRLEFSFVGTPGRQHEVVSNVDPARPRAEWEPVGIAVEGPAGTFSFVTPAAPGDQARFYLIRTR